MKEEKGFAFMKLHKWLLVIFFAFLSILPRLFYLDIPFERDEGTYANISDVIDMGGLPYRDAFDNKPPGIYYLYNLSFKSFGHSVSSPRLLAALFVMTSCILSFFFVYKVTNNYLAGIFSMVLWGIVSSSPAYQGFNSNTEIFIIPFLIGGSLLLLKDEPMPITYFIAGIIFGSAFMIKQSMVPIAFAAFLCSIFRHFRTPHRFISSSFCFVFGFFLPLFLFILYFILKEGYSDFLACAFGYNLGYFSDPSIRDMNRLVSVMPRIFRSDYITWTVGPAGIIVFVALAKKSYYIKFFLSLLAGALLSVATGKAFYPHYFLFLIPFMAMGLGLGAAQLLDRNFKKACYILVLTVLLVSVIVSIKYLRMSPEDIFEMSYGGVMPFHQSISISNYLKSQTNKDSTVYIIGSEPQILFYSGLKSPGRFFYFYPLMVQTKYKDTYREEAIITLRNNMPDYLILVNNPTSHLISNPDPFLIALSRLFFSKYELLAISNPKSDKIIVDRDFFYKAGVMTNIRNILIFRRAKEPSLKERLDFSSLFEAYLQAATERSRIEGYLSSP